MTTVEPLSIRTLWAQYWRVPVMGLLVAIIAFAGSWLVSPSYQSSTNLLVRGRDTTFLSGKGIDLSQQGGVIDSDLAKALGDTQGALLSSNSVAQEVVRKLHLDQPKPKPHGIIAVLHHDASATYKHIKAFVYYGSYKKASNFDTAVALVQNNLTATPVNDSYVLQITATADNPQLAAKIAGAAADVLVQQGNERYASDSKNYQDLLKQQVDAAAKARSDAALTVSKFKASHDISDLDTQLTLSAQSLSDMKQQLTDVTTQLNGAQAQLSSLQAAVAATEKSSTNSQTITTGRSSTNVDTTQANSVYQSLVTQRDQTEAQVAALQAQKSALERTLDGKSTASTPLTADEAHLGQLELEEQVAANNFSSLSQTYHDALLNTPQNTVELSRVDAAGVPTYPVGPLRYLYLAVGLVIGLVIGFVVSQWKVLRRRRLAAAGAEVDASDMGGAPGSAHAEDAGLDGILNGRSVQVVDLSTPAAPLPVPRPDVDQPVAGREPPQDS